MFQKKVVLSNSWLLHPFSTPDFGGILSPAFIQGSLRHEFWSQNAAFQWLQSPGANEILHWDCSSEPSSNPRFVWLKRLVSGGTFRSEKLGSPTSRGEVSKEKKVLGCITRMTNYPVIYMGVRISHHKDPYKRTSTTESNKFFFRGSSEQWKRAPFWLFRVSGMKSTQLYGDFFIINHYKHPY